MYIVFRHRTSGKGEGVGVKDEGERRRGRRGGRERGGSRRGARERERRGGEEEWRRGIVWEGEKKALFPPL